MQTIYSCLPSIDMDNCLIEGFITVWTPTILFSNMYHGWEDEMSNIAFLFTYVGWLGVCAGAIVRLGALLENLRQIPRHTRRRSKPKCKMKRRQKYLLYKRNEHKKRAKLKAKSNFTNLGWSSIPEYEIPLNKVLHRIGDKIAEQWDIACKANKGLLELAMSNNFLTCSSTTRMTNNFRRLDILFSGLMTFVDSGTKKQTKKTPI